MKKIGLLVAVILLVITLSGCSAVDTVTLDESGNVKESVIVRENNLDLQYGNNSLEDSIEEALAEHLDILNFREYNTKVVVDDEESGVNITNNYKNVCDFINKTVFSQYIYNHINCVSDKEYYTIDSVGDYVILKSDENVWNVPSKMTLRIKMPFEATENNADTVNNNTYIWYFGDGTKASKSIHLKISKSLIKQAKNKYDAKQNVIHRNNTIKTIITVIVVVLIIGVIGYLIYKFLYKRYKENKIQY